MGRALGRAEATRAMSGRGAKAVGTKAAVGANKRSIAANQE